MTYSFTLPPLTSIPRGYIRLSQYNSELEIYDGAGNWISIFDHEFRLIIREINSDTPKQTATSDYDRAMSIL